MDAGVVAVAVEGEVATQGPADMDQARGLQRKGLTAVYEGYGSCEAATTKAVGRVLKVLENSWTWLQRTGILNSRILRPKLNSRRETIPRRESVWPRLYSKAGRDAPISMRLLSGSAGRRDRYRPRRPYRSPYNKMSERMCLAGTAQLFWMARRGANNGRRNV